MQETREIGFDRYVRETNELFEDGSHIIYVNGNYKGDDEIGKLMEDFHQQDPDNMYYDALAQGVKHFKETEKGRDQMCEAVENYAKEYAKRHAEEYAKEYEIKGKIAIVQNVMESMGVSPVSLRYLSIRCKSKRLESF